MGRPRTTMSLVCPKCGKDFSNDPFGTTAVKRHVARKNPCTRVSGKDKYKKAFPSIQNIKRNNIDQLDLNHITEPTGDGTLRSWTFNILNQIFQNEENQSMILKNLKRPDEIYIKRYDKILCVTKDSVVTILLLLIHYRVYPILKVRGWAEISQFEELIWKNSLVGLSDQNWHGEIDPLCYHYCNVSNWLVKYFDAQVHKKRDLKRLSDSLTYEPDRGDFEEDQDG